MFFLVVWTDTDGFIDLEDPRLEGVDREIRPVWNPIKNAYCDEEVLLIPISFLKPVTKPESETNEV